MPRVLGDGHASPVDLEKMDGGGLPQALRDQQRGILRTARPAEATLDDSAVTFPALYQTSAYDDQRGTFADMYSIDAMQVVSLHDRDVIAGMPAILGASGGTQVYFDASAADDDDTLNAATGAYGFRAGEQQTIDMTVRYTGTAGTITATYVAPETETEVYVDYAGAWTAVTGPSAAIKPVGQFFLPPATGALTGISVWLSRAVITEATAVMTLYTTNASHLPRGAPKAVAQVDVSTVSASGEWVKFPFNPAPTVNTTTEYAWTIELISKTGAGDISIQAGSAEPSYAGGALLLGGADDWTVDGTLDMDFKTHIGGEATTNVVALVGYTGWTETTVKLVLRLAHDYYENDNAADFYLTLPEGVALNAVVLRDRATGGEVHWRADHVRTRHINPYKALFGEYSSTVDQTITGTDGAQNLGSAAVTLDLPYPCTVKLSAYAAVSADRADDATTQLSLWISDGNNNVIDRAVEVSVMHANQINTVVSWCALTSATTGSNTFRLRWQAGHNGYTYTCRTYMIVAEAFPTC